MSGSLPNADISRIECFTIVSRRVRGHDVCHPQEICTINPYFRSRSLLLCGNYRLVISAREQVTFGGNWIWHNHTTTILFAKSMISWSSCSYRLENNNRKNSAILSFTFQRKWQTRFCHYFNKIVTASKRKDYAKSSSTLLLSTQSCEIPNISLALIYILLLLIFFQNPVPYRRTH